MDWHDSKLWLSIGLVGNALFFTRFLVQWIASERAGRSFVPDSFWWLSIAGSIVLLLYAVHKRDPVFVLAYLPNCVVYVRNLMLIRKHEREARRRNAAPAPSLLDVDPLDVTPPSPRSEAIPQSAASRS